MKKFRMTAVTVIIIAVYFLYPTQDKIMTNTFYYNWLSIGNAENIYAEKYDQVGFEKRDAILEPEETFVQKGFVCINSNRLRNSNCYENLNLNANTQINVTQKSNLSTKALYKCSGNLLAEHHGLWKVYETDTFKDIAQGSWNNNGSKFYCYDDGFQIFYKVLKRFNKNNELENNFHLFGGDDLDHHEVIFFNNYVVSAGYLSPAAFAGDGLPGILKPAGQLESFKIDTKILKPAPDDNISPDRSNLLAFIQEKPLIPVYLDNFIVQPLNNKVAILNYDLKIIRVIEGDFIPLSASAGLNSNIFMTAMFGHELKLVSFDIYGNMVFITELNRNIGTFINPPAIGTDGNIYIVSNNAVVSLNKSGEITWEKYLINPLGKIIYPLMYNDIISIAYANTIMVFNPQGETILNITDIKGTINTPLISIDGVNHFVGTDSGLFEVVTN